MYFFVKFYEKIIHLFRSGRCGVELMKQEGNLPLKEPLYTAVIVKRFLLCVFQLVRP